MILHLLTDDKFADYTIKQFSAPEMKSEFVLVPSNGAMNLVELADKCIVVQQNSREFEDLLNRLDQYTGIIFHGLFWSSWQTPILQRLPANIKLAWVIWGGEIYSRCDVFDSFLAPITLSINKIRNLVKRKTFDTSDELAVEYFKKIAYCLTDAKEESDYSSKYIKKDYQHLWYNYYSLEETVGSLLDQQCSGTGVWLGNSAAIKNNHFDMLWNVWKCKLLSRLKKSQIVVPLSYGDPWVRNLVTKMGRFLYGKDFRALTDYMPREEYNALMLSCSTMINGYLQPAAQGNVITALWLGMRVYFSEKCMSYNYFKRIGCKIYSIEQDLNHKNPDVFAPMTQEDIDTNRAVLRKWYSKEEMHKRNLELVKALS